MNHKFTFKIIRSFSVGFTIFSPHYNGWLMFELRLAFFALHFNKNGRRWVGFENYWNG